MTPRRLGPGLRRLKPVRWPLVTALLGGLCGALGIRVVMFGDPAGLWPQLGAAAIAALVFAGASWPARWLALSPPIEPEEGASPAPERIAPPPQDTGDEPPKETREGSDDADLRA